MNVPADFYLEVYKTFTLTNTSYVSQTLNDGSWTRRIGGSTTYTLESAVRPGGSFSLLPHGLKCVGGYLGEADRLVAGDAVLRAGPGGDGRRRLPGDGVRHPDGRHFDGIGLEVLLGIDAPLPIVHMLLTTLIKLKVDVAPAGSFDVRVGSPEVDRRRQCVRWCARGTTWRSGRS